MRKYGVIPSPPDERDFKLHTVGITKLEQFPNEYTVPGMPGEILDQGESSQCVAHALRTIKEWFDSQNGVQKQLSNNFIYGAREPGMYQGEGMIPREALKEVQDRGVCEYNLFPNPPLTYPQCAQAITQQMLDNAKPDNILTYVSLNSVEEIKTALMQLGPVFVAVPVYNYFEFPINGKIDNQPNQNIDAYLLGYHQIVFYGWLNNYWKIQNSWGKYWGINGTALLDMKYPIQEAWSITALLNPPKPQPKAIQYEIYFDDINKAKNVANLFKGNIKIN
ncbi:peptidase [Thermoanaerobacterium phage THSA-485A]|uniref:peptidase n=1 Tax=Thermoanaerobacterium phage THSA-485A TaxID=1126885 RepID=UPI000263F82F|nr:peptidase [Thermoanaerobacterium phage THSA-485A]AFK87691.1 peptidase C1A papain [Thermoanaerobacterium phage THSA-485A]